MTRVRRRVLALSVFAALGWLLIPKPPLLDGVAFSTAAYDQHRQLLRLTLSKDQTYRFYLPLAEISPLMVEATLLHEDRHFYRHPGVNPVALARAAWRTYLGGGRRSGGSTLSMQVARARYGIDSRSLGGKLAQILRTLQLERHYSKASILEAYLNLVSYGGNIQGVGAASLIYFNKGAERLTLSEALTLSVIPQSPARRMPAGGLEADDGAALRLARARLFEKWAERHPEDRGQQAALSLPLSTRGRGQLPFLAPHFVNATTAAHPRETAIVTTLDLGLQKLIERHLRQFIDGKRHLGVVNAAALLVDYRDMGVRAAVGSVDFYDAGIQGQVNGTQAPRSPGSALKPFIYALGIDQGLLHPLTMLKDAPVSYGGYNPENFDREFSGPIKAREALIKSRNVPAVHVAAQLAEPSFYRFLKTAGVALPRAEVHYGLSPVLGGAEVTMEDLARLYAMLGNRGVLKPLRTRQDAPLAEGARLLSEEASFLVLDMLKDTPRPAQGFRAEWTRDALPVAWKTGTSHGYRDAWSIGVFGPYVLAVWIGNFDGRENAAFVGIETAAPLMFQIIDAIKAYARDLPPGPLYQPAHLARVEVCAVSGHIPGPHCRHSVPAWFIPGVSPIKTCEIHRLVAIDAQGRRACALDTPGARTEVYEFWSSDLLRLFKQAGIPRRVPPPDNPQCPLQAKAERGLPPRITSPQEGLTYSLRAANVGRETITLAAVTDADAREVFWFVDEKFLGKAPSSQTFSWTPRPGRFVLRAVDDQGRADAREVKVAVVE